MGLPGRRVRCSNSHVPTHFWTVSDVNWGPLSLMTWSGHPYLAKFLPKLADSMEPIRRLIRKNFQWSWTKEQETAFQEIKKLVTEARVLSYYNPSSDLAILCNASQKGLSAALLQDQKPVARALTETETRYAQIEKEMLAIVTLPPLHRAHLRSSTSLPMEDTSPFTAITNPLKQS